MGIFADWKKRILDEKHISIVFYQVQKPSETLQPLIHWGIADLIALCCGKGEVNEEWHC